MSRRDVGGSGRFWFVLTFAALTAVYNGCDKPKLEPTRPAPPVVVTEAMVMDVPNVVTSNATTTAVDQVTISARAKGFLKEINFVEGSDVKKGQLLFVIDEKPYQVALAQAKAQLAEANAAVQKAKESKGREVQKAQLDLSLAAQVLAKVEDTRARLLFDRKAASKGDVDLADAQFQKSNAQVEADRAALAQANADYETNTLSAQAKFQQAQAAVDDAQINLGYCRMFSPIDGRIGEALVKRENLVGATDATALATIHQLDPIGVNIEVSSVFLPQVTKNVANRLEIQIDLGGLRTKRYTGKVDFIDNAVNRSTSTFLVKAKVPNPDKDILPGEYARMYAVIDIRKNAIVVPEKAVVETQAGTTVYVVTEGKVEVAPIVVDPDTYRGVKVVKSGLTAGQKVIVEGIQLIRPGVAVDAKVVPLVLLDEKPTAGTTPTPVTVPSTSTNR